MTAGRRREVRCDEGKPFADQAVAVLADALKAGWGNRAELKESEFDPIRDRADFKRLLTEIVTTRYTKDTRK